MATTTDDLCRLVVMAPKGALEVAVPAGVPIGDLLPALLHQAGNQLAEAGLDHDGWVLQRLGEEPVDEDRSAVELGLRDGETVYLRPRQASLPAVDFDDLIDGVSTSARERADRWRPELTRWLFLGLAAASLLAALLVLLLPGPTGGRALTAGGVTLGCLLAGLVSSRALGDPAAARVFTYGAVPHAALCGSLATGVAELWPPRPEQVLAASVLVLAVAATALVVSGGRAADHVGLLVTAGGGSLGGLLATVTPWSGTQAAAVMVALALVVSASAPIMAFRLAQLRLPLLPTTVEELQQDIEPVKARLVVERTRAADRYLIALFAGAGLVAAAALTPLSGGGVGWQATAVAGATCTCLLLRARVLVGAWQRLATLAPGVYGLILLSLRLSDPVQPQTRLLVVAALAALAGLMLVLALSMPGRRLLPYWGRAGDILEWVTSLALVPLVLAVLGVYAWARAIGG